MIAHFDKQVIDALGEINYDVIRELTEEWTMKDYLNHKNAFLALCVAKPGAASMRMLSWHSDSFNLQISSTIVNAAMDSYIDAPQQLCVNAIKAPYIYFDIGITTEGQNLGIIHCFILRFENYSVYSFAFNDRSINPIAMQMLMYEYGYGICRTLAPQSDVALTLVNRMYPYHDMHFVNHKGYERKLIGHVEYAFCKKKLPSIKAWRDQ